jgi:hypothetical protein
LSSSHSRITDAPELPQSKKMQASLFDGCLPFKKLLISQRQPQSATANPTSSNNHR